MKPAFPVPEGEVQTTGPPGKSLTRTFCKTTDLVCLKSQCHFKLKKKSNGSILDLKEAKERSQPNEIRGNNTVPNPGSKYGIAVKGISLVFKAILHGMWDLSSLTRGQTLASCSVSMEF